MNQESKKEIQEKRVQSCEHALIDLGVEIHHRSKTEIRFMHKGHEVKFFPYTGWHTGKSIKDGRGFNKLTKQLKNGDTTN